MLVQEWMTTSVITIQPETSVMKASRMMKDNRIRRLPVVDEKGVLVGIVSDRDVKDASPSKATTLDMHELYYLLSEMKVKEIMSKKPIAAKATDSVEYIAHLMITKRFGGVPIVDDNNHVCGIITDSDIFKVLLSITGVKSGGIQLAFSIPNTPGSMRPLLDTLRELEASVVTVLSSIATEGDPTRTVYIRLRPLSPQRQEEIIAHMQTHYTLLYWEPGLHLE